MKALPLSLISALKQFTSVAFAGPVLGKATGYLFALGKYNYLMQTGVGVGFKGEGTCPPLAPKGAGLPFSAS